MTIEDLKKTMSDNGGMEMLYELVLENQDHVHCMNPSIENQLKELGITDPLITFDYTNSKLVYYQHDAQASRMSKTKNSELMLIKVIAELDQISELCFLVPKPK